MTEPTTLAAGAIATASTITLAVLGVDYYSLIWSMVGTLAALYWREEKLGSFKSVLYVALSTLVGAALATAFMAAAKSDVRPFLVIASAVSGFGAQAFLQGLLEAGLKLLARLGGDSK